MKHLPLIIVAPLLLVACTHKVQVEPIRVEPIHVTVDVRLVVDRELENFFDFEERYEPGTEPEDHLESAPPGQLELPPDSSEPALSAARRF